MSEVQNQTEKVHVFYRSSFVDPRKGKGWAAVLKKNSDGYIEREFIDVVKNWGKYGYIFTFEIDVPPFTILEISEGGSWKNRYRNYSEVQPDGSLKFFADAERISGKEELFKRMGAKGFAPFKKE